VITVTGDSTDHRWHEQNKREAFDGMRAYHASEIAHKAHTVEVIKTLLTLVVGAYGGLIALILKAQLATFPAVVAAAVLLLCVSGIVLYVIKKTTAKIDSDHMAYELHRAEYLAERTLSGINEDFASIGYQTHWRPRPATGPSGYSYSKRLTFALGGIVIVAAAIGAFLSMAASWTRESVSSYAVAALFDNSVLPAVAAARAADPKTAKWTIHSLEPAADGREYSVILMREGRKDGYIVVLSTLTEAVMRLQDIDISEPSSVHKAMGIAEIQARLGVIGYYTGKCDGRKGRLTEIALKQFQRHHNLAVTGELDTDTVKSLLKEGAPW